jgi:hypothetical protein
MFLEPKPMLDLGWERLYIGVAKTNVVTMFSQHSKSNVFETYSNIANRLSFGTV